MIKSHILILSGFLIIFIGITLIIVGSILQATGVANDEDSTVKTGGVVLIGPIPIIFGSDKRMAITGVILALILMFVYYILFYRR